MDRGVYSTKPFMELMVDDGIISRKQKFQLQSLFDPEFRDFNKKQLVVYWKMKPEIATQRSAQRNRGTNEESIELLRYNQKLERAYDRNLLIDNTNTFVIRKIANKNGIDESGAVKKKYRNSIYKLFKCKDFGKCSNKILKEREDQNLNNK